MDKKIICLIFAVSLFLGCGASVREGRELKASSAYTTPMAATASETGLIFSPTEVEAGLPEMRDLPVPATLKKEKARKYTGVIKNKTNYEVAVPSGNSGAALVIPAKGFIEYDSWTQRFDLTVYYNGKPFYCLKICADPQNYAYMCKQYDFLVEIVKEEPKVKPKKKMKRRKKIESKDKGVERLG